MDEVQRYRLCGRRVSMLATKHKLGQTNFWQFYVTACAGSREDHAKSVNVTHLS
jgi:hypothetical protein